MFALLALGKSSEDRTRGCSIIQELRFLSLPDPQATSVRRRFRRWRGAERAGWHVRRSRSGRHRHPSAYHVPNGGPDVGDPANGTDLLHAALAHVRRYWTDDPTVRRFHQYCELEFDENIINRLSRLFGTDYETSNVINQVKWCKNEEKINRSRKEVRSKANVPAHRGTIVIERKNRLARSWWMTVIVYCRKSRETQWQDNRREAIDEWRAILNCVQKSGLSVPLPPNVHLLTLEPWRDGTHLLRLEHVYGVGESPTLSMPVTVQLDVSPNLFKTWIIDRDFAARGNGVFTRAYPPWSRKWRLVRKNKPHSSRIDGLNT